MVHLLLILRKIHYNKSSLSIRWLRNYRLYKIGQHLCLNAIVLKITSKIIAGVLKNEKPNRSLNKPLQTSVSFSTS